MRTLLPVSLLLCLSTTALANPSLTAERLGVTNQQIVDLSCDAEQGLFLAGPAVVASIAARADALTACGPGESATVTWSWDADGKAKVDVDKTSNAAVSSCVMAAIVPQVADILGSCTATLALGQPAQAQATPR